MQKKQIHVFYKTLLVALTEKSFLRKAGLKKKTVLSLLQRERWLDGLEDILRGEVSCAAVLELCAEAMETLAGKTPQEGWLSYTYRFLIREIYPARKDISLEPLPRGAVFFYLAALRVFMEQERERLPFSRTRDFAFAEEQEVAESPYREEYGRFLECFRGQWIYELMRLGREVMPFDTLAHVAGVHHVAMHVGRQLAEAGVPVDLGFPVRRRGMISVNMDAGTVRSGGFLICIIIIRISGSAGTRWKTSGILPRTTPRGIWSWKT